LEATVRDRSRGALQNEQTTGSAIGERLLRDQLDGEVVGEVGSATRQRSFAALSSWVARSRSGDRRRASRSDPAAAREETLLHQERLVHLLERARVFAHGGSDRLDADGAAFETAR